MELMQAIAQRYSSRSYKPQQVEAGALENILAAGCAAPVSMARYDTLHLTVVQDKALIERMSTLIQQTMKVDQDPFYGVPALVIVSSQEMPMPGLAHVNAACVVQNMLLAATEQGVGSVILWASAIAIEQSAELQQALQIPEGYHATVGIGLGYADDDKPAKELQVSISCNRV